MLSYYLFVIITKIDILLCLHSSELEEETVYNSCRDERGLATEDDFDDVGDEDDNDEDDDKRILRLEQMEDDCRELQ